MSTPTYGRALLPVGLALLVALALGVIWYGKQPRGETPPPQKAEADRAGRLPDPAQPRGGPPGPQMGSGYPRMGGPRGMGFGMGGPPSEAQQAQEECVSQVARLSAALLMYSMDYDDRLPPATRWGTATYPYVQSDEAYRCPALNRSSRYAYNVNLGSARRAHLPEELVSLFDSSTAVADHADSGSSLCRPPRHPGGNSVGFLDGHAASVSEAESRALRWRPAASRPGPGP